MNSTYGTSATTGTIKSTTEKVVNDAANTMDRVADQVSHTVGDGIKSVADKARTSASAFGEKASHAAEVAIETLTDRAEKARRTAARLNEATCDYVAGNPIKSVAIAAAAGAVIAYLMSHRGRRY